MARSNRHRALAYYWPGSNGTRPLKQVSTGPSRHKGPPQMRQPFAREDRPATELQLIVGVSSASGSMISRVAPEVQFMRSVLSPKYDPSPSQADIQMTKAIIDVAAPPGVSVHDHIIVGRGGHASLKGMKLI